MSSQGELVTLHIGGSGIKIGETFWNKKCMELGVDLNGGLVDKQFITDTYFKTGSDDKLRPRAVFADLAPNEIDYINNFDTKNLFNKQLMTNCNFDSNCWANGMYTDGAEIIDKIVTNCRKEAESSDNFKGFLIFSSLLGGASGLASLASIKLNEEYSSNEIIGIHGLQDGTTNSSNLENYNSILSLNW